MEKKLPRILYDILPIEILSEILIINTHSHPQLIILKLKGPFGERGDEPSFLLHELAPMLVFSKTMRLHLNITRI